MRAFTGSKFSSFEILKLRGSVRAENIISATYEREVDGIESAHPCSQYEIEKIIKRWNALPNGFQSRCHIPGFAIKISNENELLFLATICWQCDNIHIIGSCASKQLIEFDGSLPEAQALLNLFNKLINNS